MLEETSGVGLELETRALLRDWRLDFLAIKNSFKVIESLSENSGGWVVPQSYFRIDTEKQGSSNKAGKKAVEPKVS